MKQRIFAFVFNSKPFTYAITYFLLIPLFALLYALFPGQFYHSTAKYEFPVKSSQTDEILSEMTSQIIADSKKNIRLDSNGKLYPRYLIDELLVPSIRIEGDRYYFSLCYTTEYKKDAADTGYSLTNTCYELSFPVLPYYMVDELGPNGQHYYHQLKTERTIDLIDSNYMGDGLSRIFRNGKDKILYLVVDRDLEDKLAEYARTIDGFPSSLGNNYWRMFYFSSVTITTVGYGDIVPIGNTARTLISLEAILGVTLIGLFLNALSKRTK